MIDCYSKFCILALVDNLTASTTAAVLNQRLFSVFGAPHTLRCDNGTAFKGEVQLMCTAKGVRLARSSPYTSHSNGQVERLHHTIEELLRRALITVDATAWPTLMPEVQLAINCTYAKSIGCPPYLVMFGSTPPDQLSSLMPDPTTASITQYTSALRR